MTNRRAAAVHEAGHAVAASALGLRVQSLSLNDEDDWAGHTNIGGMEHLPIVDQVAICWAGTVAERLLNCEKRPYANLHDLDRISGLLKEYAKQEGYTIRMSGLDRAGRVLQKHLSQLSRVASRLAATGHITADEFESLISTVRRGVITKAHE